MKRFPAPTAGVMYFRCHCYSAAVADADITGVNKDTAGLTVVLTATDRSQVSYSGANLEAMAGTVAVPTAPTTGKCGIGEVGNGEYVFTINYAQTKTDAAGIASVRIKDTAGNFWTPGVVDTGAYVQADLRYILGTLLTETAGYLAAAFKKLFNVAAPTGTVNSLPDAVAGATNGLAIVGTKNPATLAAGDVTGNLPVDVQTIKTRAAQDVGSGNTAYFGTTAFPAWPANWSWSTYAGGDTAGTTTLLQRLPHAIIFTQIPDDAAWYPIAVNDFGLPIAGQPDLDTLMTRIPQALEVGQINNTGPWYVKAINSSGTVISGWNTVAPDNTSIGNILTAFEQVGSTGIFRLTGAAMANLPKLVWDYLTSAATTTGSMGAAILAKLGLIGPAVGYVGPMGVGGSFTIYAGDDVSVAWSITGWTVATPSTATLRLCSETDYLTDSTLVDLLTATCTPSLNSTTLTVTFALTAAQTAALPYATALRAQVIATTAGAPQTIVDAKGICRRRA